MNYLESVANRILSQIPSALLPQVNGESLCNLYASLVFTKGVDATASDVHDMWVTWQVEQDAHHPDLVPYDQLASDVQQRYSPVVLIIREEGKAISSSNRVSSALTPYGPPATQEDRDRLFELYKIMVQSSESLVSRRQGVNTFFITVNGAIIAALGFFIRAGGGEKVKSVGVVLICLTGLILSFAWKGLIISFGKLNTGKFAVINRLERYLPASIFYAEWEALERGQNPKVYRSTTSREIWAPYLLAVLYGISAIGSLLVAVGTWRP
ncbi:MULTISPECIES: hypothetical protein [unclassified Streptomyces]|uniref:RipA family octameric membrane protein n=1 Tax=unclassified Streptomyces TaxID=2593676 RepID=UPI0036E429B0